MNLIKTQFLIMGDWVLCSGDRNGESIKKAPRLVLFLLIFLVSLPTPSLAAQLKVTWVYDGDTIKVVGGHGVARKVRLVGIDAPETCAEHGQPGQPYSQRAKKYLASLILNEAVFILKYETDAHDRILAVVYRHGININLEMVRAGLAEVYRGIPSPGLDLKPYWQAEKEAKKAKRGMWRLGDKYVSPRKWRRGR